MVLTMGRNQILRESRSRRVIILEELDFVWDEPDLKKLVMMWNAEVSVINIAKHFDRDPAEVLLAVIHLALERKIKPRKTGLGEWA